MPLAQDTVQITTRAAPACGADGVQKVAFHQAAVETAKGITEEGNPAGGFTGVEARIANRHENAWGVLPK
jgi:hypothetical protein